MLRALTLPIFLVALWTHPHPLRAEVQAPPLSPEESLRKVHVPAGFKVELVAAEPLLLDPVAFDWDERGRLWVVEMADYPLGMDNHGQSGGRVRVLEDRDGDGRYEHSTLFADGLHFPNGLLTWRDGVIVTAAPHVLFLRDTNGDGKADAQQVLVSGLQEGNQQLRANGLRWGLDHWVYVAAGGHHGKYGIDTKLKSARTGQEVLVGSRDFRFRPDTGALEPQSGPTQFGRNRDNWGRWFGTQNANPLWHYVLPDHYLRRNPHVGAAETRVQLLTPPSPPVFPASALEKRFHSFEQSGHFTSACSGMVCRDTQLFPGEEMHAFVCEPFHNLVQHARLTDHGVTFTATREAGEKQFDFFASEDRWCPVMVREGPAAVAPLRELAASSARPLARLHALCTLDGFGELTPAAVTHALGDEHPGVRENALRLAETRFSAEVLAAAARLAGDADAKVRLQLAFSLGASPCALAGETLARLLKAHASDAMMVAAVMSSATPHLRALARVGGETTEPLLNTALGLNDRVALTQLLAPTFTPFGAHYSREQLAAFTRLLDLLARNNSSLVALRGEGDALAELLGKADSVVAQAGRTATDASAPADDRIAAASLLSRLPASRAEAIALLTSWLDPRHPAGPQSAALHALGATGAPEVPAALAKAWPALGPFTRLAALGAWMNREPWAFDLAQRLQRGELPISALDATQRTRLLKHESGRVRKLAVQFFAAGTSAARGQIVADYQPALALPGDIPRGREVFLRACAVCHRRGADGKDLGPDLISVVAHPPEKLLASILDPNVDIQPGFNAYTCTLENGEQIYGLVAAETANSVTMKLPDATSKTVLRSQIAALQSQHTSLMPEGLEAAITKQEMADLILFLRTPAE